MDGFDAPHDAMPWCGLDPVEWSALRALGHRMLDDMMDHLAGIAEQPVWTRLPDALRNELADGPLPRQGEGAEAAYDDFRRLVLPYATGNLHPRFMGWVHGGGNPVGMLAELLAGALNANLGGRDHAPIEVERQVIRWAADMVGLPETSSGLLVTGTSIANMIALLVARTFTLGPSVRHEGLQQSRLVAYTSQAIHDCIPAAMDMTGIGTDALRRIRCDSAHRIDLAALRGAIANDRAAGLQPFFIAGTAGTVDVGAIDDLDALAELCAAEGIWFHVDAAFAALVCLSPKLRPLLRGIERADSVAFDFHKWGQVPYDAGCILVREQSHQLATFASPAAYLRRESRGLAGGHPWPCDLGPDLSRGFRALKVWMTLKAYGADRLGAVAETCCANASYLAERVAREATLELLAPVTLNTVCFRICDGTDDLDRLNADIVIDLHESGLVAPSTTFVDGRLAIRAAITNHRTQREDMDALVDMVLATVAKRKNR